MHSVSCGWPNKLCVCLGVVYQGPLTEEFVFRSCMIPLLVCANFTVKQIILGSPLTFGVGELLVLRVLWFPLRQSVIQVRGFVIL